jgi:hypothetical protein
MVCQFELRIKKIAFFLIKRVESVGTNKHQSALTIKRLQNRNKSFMEIRQQEALCKDNVQKTLDFLYKKLILIASQHFKCFQR